MENARTRLLYDLGAAVFDVRGHFDPIQWDEDGDSKPWEPFVGPPLRVFWTFMQDQTWGLKLSRRKAESLHRWIRKFNFEIRRQNRPVAGPSRDTMVPRLARRAMETVDQFESVLFSELASVNCFVTAPKKLFDLDLMINSAESAFSEEERSLLPEQCLIDFAQAARCLAFAVYTASGFHMMRATESAVRQYHALISGRKRKWGSLHKYIEELGNEGADKKVLSTLSQLKDLYRNPIAHPDENLTESDAISLFGITQSVLTAITEQLTRISHQKG